MGIQEVETEKGDITSQVICAYALGKIIFRVA
jgi:hypothetical protein